MQFGTLCWTQWTSFINSWRKSARIRCICDVEP